MSEITDTVTAMRPDENGQTKQEPETQVAGSASTQPEAPKLDKVDLADMCAKGTAHFAHKEYAEAVDLYARAAELQAELNGETNPDNAEILFLYGRAVFRVAQENSDLLGGTAKPATVKEEAGNGDIAEKTNGKAVAKEEDGAPKKPHFQFEGDEESDDEGDDGAEGDAEGADDEDEEDDFAVAFDVLEVARLGFEQRLKEPEISSDKGKSSGDSEATKHIKERLAETHDLLAEISLENERFPNAIQDFRAALSLKEALYPFESEVIAEAWYKLSLALEFASITQEKSEDDDEEANLAKETSVDEAMREESAKALVKAIDSTKLKLKAWEAELASDSTADSKESTVKKVADVKEIIAEMESRLHDVRAAPVDVKGLSDLTGGNGSLAGILGETLGETPEQVKARLEEANKNANDLSNLVRKKDKNGKRQANEDLTTNGKKIKTGEA